ncbi:MAG: hypothetical protein AAF438_06070, partial [Pseudomonadota bacterium]
FILSKPGAPEADLIAALGFVEGPPNTHPGQGTANRRFFFQNFGLELLFVEDEKEARDGPAAGLRIPDRVTHSGASPFGLIARHDDGDDLEPFPSWRYYPQYFEAEQYFSVGSNSETLEEPLCVCMPKTLPDAPSNLRKPNSHLTLASLQLSVPTNQPSKALDAMVACDLVSLQLNMAHHMVLVFNEGSSGNSKDLLPVLPLTVYW